MDHNEIVRERTTERYLLNELDPVLRDQFEEHLFDCQECAADVRAAAMFVEQSKAILSEPPAVPVPVPVPAPALPAWLAWFRPAFAVPVFAMLLGVIGYQQFAMERVAKPVVLAATAVNLLTYGANPSPLVVHAGEGFLLNVIVPPDKHYASYRADLHNPAGGVELSIPIAGSAADTWPIQIPGAKRASGTYKLMVYGVNAEGKEVEVGSGSFELQIQN